jgi:hypothetical protein
MHETLQACKKESREKSTATSTSNNTHFPFAMATPKNNSFPR